MVTFANRTQVKKLTAAPAMMSGTCVAEMIRVSYELVGLGSVPFSDVYKCFTAAFVDYAVDVTQLSEAGLLRRTRKNGWVPELSLGVQAGGSLVGITLIGVDEVVGEQRAYDICTGIVPGHRGNGLAGLTMSELRKTLPAAGISALQLEVLQDNQAAIRAYQKVGFSTRRALNAFTAVSHAIRPAAGDFDIRAIDADLICRFSTHLSFEPSFENRDFAIRHLHEDLILLGAFDGYDCKGVIAYDMETRWLMRLVSHRDHRRRGVASALVSALSRQLPANSEIKALNVDEQDHGTQAVLRRCGFDESVRQWEMRLEL